MSYVRVFFTRYIRKLISIFDYTIKTVVFLFDVYYSIY